MSPWRTPSGGTVVDKLLDIYCSRRLNFSLWQCFGVNGHAIAALEFHVIDDEGNTILKAAGLQGAVSFLRSDGGQSDSVRKIEFFSEMAGDSFS